MSQNTRATGASSGCQGRIWNVLGSGRASTSLSWTRLKPSMADPSKVMPSSRAFSSSAGVMAKVLGVPRTSVNHSWTKRTPRSSTVRSTYSCWLRMSPPLERRRRPLVAGRVLQCRRPGGLGDEFIRRSQTGNGREIPAWQALPGEAARRRRAGTPDPMDLWRPGSHHAWCPPSEGTRPVASDRDGRPRRNRAAADPGGGAPPGAGRGHRDRRRPVRRPARPHAALLGPRPRARPRTSSRRASASTARRSGASRRSRSRTCSSCPTPTRPSIDPFRQHKTLNINCFVRDPVTLEPYSRDPRYVASKAEAYLRHDRARRHLLLRARGRVLHLRRRPLLPGPAPRLLPGRLGRGALELRHGRGPEPRATRSAPRRGTSRSRPTDHFQDLRSEMILTMERLGIEIEVQHHEVATAGQAEIDMRFDTLLVMADKLMLYKYVVKNVARAAGYTATFMPKPLFQDNGSGMHCHQSLWKDGEPLFYGDGLRRAVGHGPLVHRRPAQARPGGARLRGARPPTPTSGWCPATRHRSTWSTRSATARPPAASRCTRRARRPSGSSSAAPTRRATRTWPSRPCSWPASTACRTRSSRPTRSTRTSTTCRPRSWRRSPRCRARSTRRSTRSRPTTTS